jgi:RHS repeat-associated protein
MVFRMRRREAEEGSMQFSRIVAVRPRCCAVRALAAPVAALLLLLMPASEWAGATPPTLPANSISYGYDSLGRLTTVIDPSAGSNGVATYAYDAVGNLTSIGRVSSASVSIVQLNPSRGATGSKVVIYGTGFSATASENSVSFGGTAATVSMATTSQLHVNVPSAAVTGPVSVTTPAGTAQSPAAFSVTVAPQAPEIATVSPVVADPGTTITLTGNRFGTTTGGVTAAIAQIRAKVATATSTGLTFTVPPVATSGKVLVATADGSATSSVDVFVPPRGSTAAQVVATGRMAIGELNRVVSVAAADKLGLVVFDANAGQHVFLNLASSTMQGVVRLFDPFGLELASNGFGTGSGYLDTQRLPTTGTYAIVVDPLSGGGDVSLSLYDAAPSTGTIAADGQPHSIPSLTLGKNARRTFSGAQGQRVFLKIDSQISSAIVKLLDDKGIVLGSAGIGAGTGYIDTRTLTNAGTYTILVDPSGASVGSATLTLYDVPPDSTGSIVIGTPAAVTTTAPGQNANRTFSGVAGQRISINLTNSTFAANACNKLSIEDPNGTTLASNTCFIGSAFIEPQPLLLSGVYRVVVDPANSSTGSATLTLYDVPADSSGSIAFGSAQTVTLSTPGQNAERTFTGTAGQRISLNVSSVSFGANYSCGSKIFIYRPAPDGTILGSQTCVQPPAGSFIDTMALDVTGTYRIVVDPTGGNTGSATLTLYDVPPDQSGTVTIGGPSSTVSISTPGQNGTRSFSGTSGQQLTLTLSAVTIAGSTCCSAKVSIQKPDGLNLVSPTSFGTSGKTINTQLTATGTHTIKIDPQGSATGSATLSLSSSSGLALVQRVSSSGAIARPEEGAAAASQPESAAPQPDPPAISEPSLPEFQPAGVEEWNPPNTEPSTWQSGRPESPFASLPPLQAAAGTTAVAGQVLRLDGLPLADVTVASGKATTVTDETGRFLLTGVEARRSVVTVDATSANRPGATYGIYELGVDTKKGQTTALPFTIWSPKLDTTHQVDLHYPLEKEVVLTTPLIPDLEIRIPAGSEIHDRRGRLVRKLGITAVPLDRSPFPMPGRFPVYFTVQPGAAYVWPHGVEVIYPNKMHAPAGERVEFYSYDPQDKGWHVYGRGSVTADGKQIRFDRGTRQYELTSSGICVGCVMAAAGVGGFFKGFTMGGDPIDLATGVFSHKHTDLVERGSPQLDVSRVYRSNDPYSRAFGIGNSMTYSMALYAPDDHLYEWADLILADGSRIRFERISPGTGYSDMVLEATSTPGPFYKARISWSGRGWEMTRTDGTILTFPNGGTLESIRDKFGNQITVHTNSILGDVSNVLSSSGRWLKFSYGSGRRVSQVEDQSGRSVSYTYDAGYRLWKVTDAKGGVTEHSYDSADRMTTIKDPRNITWLTNQYDANGRVDRQTLADGSVWQLSYTADAEGKVIQTDLTNPRGYVRRLTFNGSGYPITDTSAYGTPRAQETAYTYDATSNRITSITDPRGRRTDYAYNGAGKLVSFTRLAGTSNALTTSFSYEPQFNQLASVVDPLGHGPTYEYDSRGALVSATDATGNETTLTTNVAGQVTSVVDPLASQSTFSYTLGDLAVATDANGSSTRFAWDSAGRPSSVTDALGGMTRVAYDSTDALTTITDAQDSVTSFERDGNGNLTKLTDGKLHDTSYTYDSMDRVATRTDPLGRVESYSYDFNGNLAEITDRKGQRTTLGYDELDRLTFTGFDTTGPPGSPSHASTIDYSYDNANRLTSATDSATGTITRTFDDHDRPTTETSDEGSIAYTYDNAHRRQTMAITGQPAVSYGYDNADRVTSVTRSSLTAGMSYDAAGRLQTLTLPNGIVQTYAYDGASNLVGIEYTRAGTSLGNLVYGTDPNGLRTAVGGSFAITGLPAAVSSTSYDAANRLTSWGGASLTYDDNGNLTADGTKAYTWDERGQLASLVGGGITAAFAYDAFGRRLDRTVDGVQTRYLHDRDTPTQELSASGAVVANHLAGLHADEIFAIVDGGGTRSLISDALGSTIAVADASGGVQGEYTYEPFGKLTHSGAATAGYQFTGREADGTGLQFNRARYYSPEYGRFVSEDPLGFAGGDINLYAYVGNSPLNAVDPSGMSSIAVPIPGGLGGFGAKAGWAGAFYTGGFIAGTAARKHFGGGSPFGGHGGGVPFGEHGGGASSPGDNSRQSSSGSTSTGGATGGTSAPRRNNPYNGPPNGSEAYDNANWPGAGQIRDYGPDGKPQTDYDFGHDHHGMGDPHAHDWINGERQDPRPIRPGESVDE